MGSRTQPSFGDIVNRRLAKALQALGVATPGTVVSYSDGLATVRPGVHRLVPSMLEGAPDNVEEFAAIQNVPVMFLAGRGIAVDPAGRLLPGDPVLLICLDRDPSGWRRSGDPAEPDDARLHDWSNAVAIPGLLPDTNPFPTPVDAAALASKIATDLAQIAAMLDLAQAGTGFTNTYTAALNSEALVKARIASNILKLDS